MNYHDIKPNTTLRLKAARARAYGMEAHPYVVVTGLRYRTGYKVPHVISRDLAFTPSDFERQVKT